MNSFQSTEPPESASILMNSWLSCLYLRPFPRTLPKAAINCYQIAKLKSSHSLKAAKTNYGQTYLIQTKLTIARVVGRNEGSSELHDILQVDALTCILLAKVNKNESMSIDRTLVLALLYLTTYSATISRLGSAPAMLLSSSSCSCSFFDSFLF